ncbi:alpha/beta hydrolase family protein [Actinomadura hibisca]|uniref:alpha/beta hydrolase family protein n=1 Tax=Actinomadura hibisca TaxID=68565 RepID=UPI00082FBFCD|nr:alpha/beta fold hydrolase [Actinomadura hibisca]
MTLHLDLSYIIAGNRSRTAAAGIDPFHYERATAGIGTAREWTAAFLRTGRERLADAERADSAISAGEAYRDAALWFHFAAILPVPGVLGEAEAAADEAMGRALKLLEPSAERVEGVGFAGWLRRPAGVARPALVVVVPGMDSSKEEFTAVADALLRRGLATLAIDGPGQGVLAATTAPDADYGRVVGRALDAVGDRPDLDASGVGVIGLSLGGFYAALTAAREPRVRAAVTVSGPYRLSWAELPPFVTETLTLRAGDAAAARAFADRVDLTDLAPEIAAPLLVVDGDTDVIPGVVNGAPLAAAAPQGEYLSVPGGDHLVGNVRAAWLPLAADRLARALTA